MGEEKRERLDTPYSGQNVEIQKLGWLSSYSRQVLLSRHALRTFYVLTDQMIRFEADMVWQNSHNTARDTLRLLRALIEVLSGINTSSTRVSAPYEPGDRPITFFLGETRVGRLLAVSTDSPDLLGMHAGTSFSTNGLSTGNNASWISQAGEEPAKGVLADEIAHVRKGVGLSNKSLGDTRCEELLDTRLWPPEQGRVWQAGELFAPFNTALNGAFEFWREWYQGFLDGKPLDWELQRRVALIPDDDWEKGPEHIAQKIEEIRARFELEKRLEELEAEKHLWQERARLGIGGNNPPEAIEDARMVQEIIWAPIEELKAETQSETPDNSRIKSAISKLGAALIAIGKWPLGKLDKAADEFAKSLGKWGGGACAGWLALNSDKIAEIIKAAQDWLGTLF